MMISLQYCSHIMITTMFGIISSTTATASTSMTTSKLWDKVAFGTRNLTKPLDGIDVFSIKAHCFVQLQKDTKSI